MSKRKNQDYFNSRFPSIADLRTEAKKRIPRFAFEYLDGGANDEVNMAKNSADFHSIELMPRYLEEYTGANLETNLFGRFYSAPFGIAPIGLQGLMWPNAPMILARSAFEKNIPFILSTVSTASIEEIAKVTESQFWFQLYHPAEDRIKVDLLRRCWDSGCRVLVLLADAPSFGIRYKDVKNGLSMPPKMSVANFLQIASKPNWALQTLVHGQPNFQSLKPYMPKGLNLSQLGQFMNKTFNGRLTEEKIKSIREQWKGKLVIKGIVNEEDMEKAIALGVDGFIVSNHGGRQIDAGESSIHSLQRLAKTNKGRVPIMIDGGIRSGVDVGRSLASGADFVFMGRPFMYGVGALGGKGGTHVVNVLHAQLKQVMEQLGCEQTSQFPNSLIKSKNLGSNG